VGISWTGAIILWIICAGIGAAITNSKNRGAGDGLVLGGLLGIIGVIIAACLSKQVPKAPPGMISVQCPRCNAAQNAPEGQPQYECWQCHTTSQAPGFEDLLRPIKPKPAATPPNTSSPAAASRSIRCNKCQTVFKVVPTATKLTCPSCDARLKIAPKVAT
jgi:phage FluMu protein Com